MIMMFEKKVGLEKEKSFPKQSFMKEESIPCRALIAANFLFQNEVLEVLAEQLTLSQV